jgi:hypothetical protein
MLLRDYEADRSPVPKGAPPLPQFPTDWGAFARSHGLTPAPPKNASVVVLRSAGATAESRWVDAEGRGVAMNVRPRDAFTADVTLEAAPGLPFVSPRFMDLTFAPFREGWTWTGTHWHLELERVSPASVRMPLIVGRDLTRTTTHFFAAHPARLLALLADPAVPLDRGEVFEILEATRVVPPNRPDIARARLALARGLGAPSLIAALLNGPQRAAAVDALLDTAPDSPEAYALVDLLVATRDASHAHAAARAAAKLRTMKHPLRDRHLLTLLSSPHAEVKLSAVETLREIGTPAVIPALRAVAAKADATLEHVTESAIKAIQDRAKGEPGSLALAEHEGALSLQED